MIDFDKLCNEFCTGMDLYKTITKLHHMDIKYHVVNTDNTFCFMIPIIDGIAEIEIDKWPMIDPYLEIECDNDDTINEIIEKLDLKNNKIVSINAEELYREKGIDINTISELKF